MNVILFDSDARHNFLPLVATRPMGELTIGAMTLRARWERFLHASASYITQDYLQPKYPIHIASENLVINAGFLATPTLCERVVTLDISEALLWEGELVAARLNEDQFEHLLEDEAVESLKVIEGSEQLELVPLKHLWQLTRFNGRALQQDFEMLSQGRRSEALSPSNRLIGPIQNLFLEEGVKMECCILNLTTGPIYIGKNAEVMEGSTLRGPIAIGEDAIVKMGAKIYGPTTIGPGCRAGGEITRSILSANSNKGHEGYLGDSVLGEWCNLGADTNNSNLKNNYGEVRLWNYEQERFEYTGEQFCGLFMGDHSKCSINTMFNTGTVVGVCANIFGAGFPRNFVPDFSWGGADSSYRTHRLEEAFATAEAVLTRRGKPFTDLDKEILTHIFQETAKFRTFK